MLNEGGGATQQNTAPGVYNIVYGCFSHRIYVWGMKLIESLQPCCDSHHSLCYQLLLFFHDRRGGGGGGGGGGG